MLSLKLKMIKKMNTKTFIETSINILKLKKKKKRMVKKPLEKILVKVFDASQKA